MSTGARVRLLLRVFSLLAAVLGAAPVFADPPARVARVNHVEGSASLAPAGDNEWIDAPRNRPLTRGDRLWIDRGSRAELQIAASTVRLNGPARLDLLLLDDRSAQLSLTRGSVSVRVRSLPEGENFEIDTPNLAYRVAFAGDYRIDVDPDEGTTRVTVHSGAGAVYGESGEALALGGGQQITFRGRALAQLAVQEAPPLDAFDRWAQERSRREDQSIAARHVPREVVGFQSLDPHGQWRHHPTHGAIWFPQGLAQDWAPYRHGHWEWIAPWGWTWIDDAPWGFAPFHFGRWALVDEQWAWVPGRLGTRPVYAPALVAFVGGDSGLVTWFPLAPGEAWQPPYRASRVYLGEVNRHVPLAAGASHAHQRSRQALSSVAAAEFQRGRPAAAGWWRVAANLLTNAAVVPPPPMPAQAPPAPALARRVPLPAPAAVRQVVADAVRPAPAAAAPNVAAAPATDAQAPVDSERPRGTPRPAVRPQPATAPFAPAGERSRSAAAKSPLAREQVSRTAQAERERREQARRADDMRRAAAARQAEQARRDAHAHREAQARRQELARREAQARSEALARRQAQARRDAQVRRQAHASQVEQARRAAEREAQAFDEQRRRREEQARRAAQAREQAQREAWEREQQAITEQWRREHDAWEQRQRTRGRPDLRSEPRFNAPARPAEVWQRGLPLAAPGRTS